MSAATLERARPVTAQRRPDKAADAAGVLADGFAVMSVVALWTIAQLLFLGGLAESRAQTVLFQDLRSELAAATAPTGGVIAPGSPVAIMTIPKLDRELVVVEGTASGDLLAGPGHRRDTALPGQEGVSLVYGRARTYGAPLGDITKLGAGDVITALTQQGRATFRVDGVRRSGDPVPQPLGAGQGRLTLVSAESNGALPALTAGHTVYVDASLQGKAFVAPLGRPNVIPASERAMASDTGALPLLALCLALLLGVVSGVVVGRKRWSTTLVWVLAAPVVMALAWGSTDVVMRLLPNLL